MCYLESAENLGLNMNGIHQVLAYADGVNLIGRNIGTIERNADVLLNACEDIGLAVNIGKTKYMGGRPRLSRGNVLSARSNVHGFKPG